MSTYSDNCCHVVKFPRAPIKGHSSLTGLVLLPWLVNPCKVQRADSLWAFVSYALLCVAYLFGPVRYDSRPEHY